MRPNLSRREAIAAGVHGDFDPADWIDDPVCRFCGADLHLDRSDTGPGGWLGTHDPRTTHPFDQNSVCCPGTQTEHEPKEAE